MADRLLTCSATCTLRGEVDEKTGEALSSRQATQRVSWLAAITTGLARSLLENAWNQANLATLAGGVGPDGRALPARGYVALRRLGWDPAPAAGLYVPDRVNRCAQEHAARLLRGAIHRDAIITAVVATWPQTSKRTAERWAALWAALPAGTTKVEVRGRDRQVGAHLAEHGMLPDSVCTLEGPPAICAMVALAAADNRLVTLERTGPGLALLRVKLPTCPRPESRADWAWVALSIKLPSHVPAADRLHTPTLRVCGGRVLVDVPFSRSVAVAPRKGHVVALGADWGLNTVLTATTGRLQPPASPDGGDAVVVTNGRPLHFKAAGVQAKIARLRLQRQKLYAKADRCTRRLEAAPPGVTATALTAKRDLLLTGAERVSARQRRLGDALARGGARWLLEQAQAAGATAIYVEDLSTLEGRGLGRRLNARLSEAGRGKLLAALRHQGAKESIAVVSVPAKGTSALCPRCLGPLRHTRAPDDDREGWKWARCPSCGLSADRDHAAAERIVSRGLAGQDKTRATKARTYVIATPVETRVRLSRDKKLPTLRVVRHRGRSKVYRGPRLTRSVPAPSASLVADGQRPAGRHQEPLCRKHSGPVLYAAPTASRSTASRRKTSRAIMEAAGVGFHRGVRASPVRVWPGVLVTPMPG